MHWMQLLHEQPGLEPDSVFYWIDIFALSPDGLSKPLCASGEQLQQVPPRLVQWAHMGQQADVHLDTIHLICLDSITGVD